MTFATLLLLAALIDMIGGLFIVLSVSSFLHSLLLYLGIIVLFKGIMSLLYSIQKSFYFDFLGWVDILSGMLLLLMFIGLPVSFVWIFGVLLLAKGIWSLLFVF